MPSPVGPFQPVFWSPEAVHCAGRGKGWRKVARFSDQFWSNLSSSTEAVRVKDVGETALYVERYTRKLDKAHYKWMAFELFCCVCVLPLIVMLVAKACVRNHYMFVLQPSETRARPSPLEKEPTTVIPHEVSNIVKMPKSLLEAVREEEGRKTLCDRIEQLPKEELSLLAATDAEGLTLLHYAYLYGDKALQRCLESKDKELAGIATMKDLTIRSDRGGDYVLIPKGKTPPEFVQDYQGRLARLVLECRIRGGEVPRFPYWPWEGVPSLENTLSLLDRSALNSVETGTGFSQGMTLLHLAKVFRHAAIAQALIANGADPNIQSTHEFQSLAFQCINGSPGVLKIPPGLTADQLQREFWDQFYFEVACIHMRGAHTENVKFFGYDPLEGRDLENVISHIGNFRRQNARGLTLMHHAVLFGFKEVEKQLRAKESALDGPVSISWKGYVGRYCSVWLSNHALTPVQLKEYLMYKMLIQILEFSGSKSTTVTFPLNDFKGRTIDNIKTERTILQELCTYLATKQEFAPHLSQVSETVAALEDQDAIKKMQECLAQLKYTDLLNEVAQTYVSQTHVTPHGIEMNKDVSAGLLAAFHPNKVQDYYTPVMDVSRELGLPKAITGIINQYLGWESPYSESD